jgi:hypothetical protein
MKIPQVPQTKSERYITTGFQAQGFGSVTGVLGTGSLGLNDYSLNGNASIAQGTSISTRVGNKIYFTTLKIKGVLHCTIGTSSSRIRLVVVKSVDPKIANQTTNSLITAIIESSAVLESPIVSFNSQTAPPVDWMVCPSSDYKIVVDKEFYAFPASGTVDIPINLTVPLKVTRGYDNSGNLVSGSFAVYFCAPSGTSSAFSGVTKVSWVDLAG